MQLRAWKRNTLYLECKMQLSARVEIYFPISSMKEGKTLVAAFLCVLCYRVCSHNPNDILAQPLVLGYNFI